MKLEGEMNELKRCFTSRNGRDWIWRIKVKSRTRDVSCFMFFLFLLLEEEMVRRENVEFERYLWIT